MKHFTLLKTFMLACMLMCGMGAWAERTTIYSESFSASSNTLVTACSASNFTGGITPTAVNTTGKSPNGWKLGTGNAGSGTGFSGGANLWSATANTTVTFTFGDLLANYTDVKIAFNYYKGSANGSNNTFTLAFSNDGGTSFGSNVLPANASTASNWYSVEIEIPAEALDDFAFKFTQTGTQTNRIDDIKITGIAPVGDNVDVMGISLDKSTLDMVVGKKATLVATIAPNNATNKNVTWSSNNTNVATVSDGLVTAVAEGNATITVTTEDGNYVATCDVTVAPFVQTYANTFTSGDELLTTTGGSSAGRATVVWEEESYDAIKAGTSNNAGVVKVTVPANTKTLHVHIAGWNNDGKEVTVEGLISDVVLPLTSDSGISGNGTSYTLKNDPETNDYFSIDTNNAEPVTLTFTATIGKRFVIFGVNAEPQVAPATSTDVTISDAGYATFYDAEHAVTLPEGVTGYVFTADGGLQEAYGTKESDKVVPAGEPLVLGGAANTYTLNYTTSSEDTWKSIDMNDLCGAATDMIASEMAAANTGMSKFYALSLNAAGEASSVGFYFVEDGGAAFDISAGKAYLALPADAPAKFFVFNEETGINNVEANANDNRMFNLAGQRVNANAKGIVIMNGKKFINK